MDYNRAVDGDDYCYTVFVGSHVLLNLCTEPRYDIDIGAWRFEQLIRPGSGDQNTLVLHNSVRLGEGETMRWYNSEIVDLTE